MSGQRKTVLGAPGAALIGKCRSKAFGNKIVIMIAYGRYTVIRQIPKKLGKMGNQRIVIFCEKFYFIIISYKHLFHKRKMGEKFSVSQSDRVMNLPYCLFVSDGEFRLRASHFCIETKVTTLGLRAACGGWPRKRPPAGG